MPYCSSIHISQPPGMLPAPFHKPTFVAGLRRNPSTAGTRSAPATAMPIFFAALSTIFWAAGVDGITHVPAGNVRTLGLSLSKAGFEGLAGAIHRHVRLLQFRDRLEEAVRFRVDEIGALRARAARPPPAPSSSCSSSGASNGLSATSTVTPISIHSVWPVTSYGGSGGPPGNTRRSG